MAEPVMRTEDLRPMLPDYPITAQLPRVPREAREERLNKPAEAIGSAVGFAVNRVRQLPQRLADMKARFTVIRGRARDEAAVSASEMRRTAEDKAREVGNRAQYLANEYPIQSILGIAGAAFVVGVVLRIWRSSRA